MTPDKITATIDFKDIPPKQPFRRYIDLPKLFDMLANKHLVMPRLRQLAEGDPFECSARKRYDYLECANPDRPKLEQRAKELWQLAPEPDRSLPFRTVLSDSFDKIIQEMPLKELRNALSYLELERLKRDVVCSCWHKGTGESDAMWKIYAAQLGVCIESSRERLESAISIEKSEVGKPTIQLTMAAVEYSDVKKSGDREPWLVKRNAFRFEEEARLYCDVPFSFGRGLNVPVDLSRLIKEIVITPFAKEWQVPGIQSAIEAVLRDAHVEGIEVRSSEHMRKPETGWPQISLGKVSPEVEKILRPSIP